MPFLLDRLIFTLGIVAIAYFVSRASVQVKIIHEHRMHREEPIDPQQDTEEVLDKQQSRAYRLATTLIKPWRDRRARGRQPNSE